MTARIRSPLVFLLTLLLPCPALAAKPVPVDRLLGKWQSTQVGIPFADLDRDGDEKLTQEEVRNTPLAAGFKDTDANEDQRLDLSEFDAFWLKSPSSDLVLQLNVDRSLRLTIPAGEKQTEPRTGSFTLRGGVWVLTFRDLDGREYRYGLGVYQRDQFQLIGPQGDIVKFQRAK